MFPGSKNGDILEEMGYDNKDQHLKPLTNYEKIFTSSLFTAKPALKGLCLTIWMQCDYQ